MDKMHGEGKIKFEDGSEFIGSFSDDKKHGKGVFTMSDSSRYEGNF